MEPRTTRELIIILAVLVIALVGSQRTVGAIVRVGFNRETVATVKTSIEKQLADAELDRKGRKRLQKASDFLARAMEDLAIEDISSALRHLKRAVRKLIKAEKLGLVVEEGVDILVEAARQAAVDMLGQARRYAGSSKKIDRLIRRASQQLEKAQQAWAEGKARNAIRHARNAWKKAHMAAVLGSETSPPPPGLEAFTAPTFCAGPLQVQGVNAFVCEFPFNWVFEASDLAPFATSQFGVTIQAVGGNGGDGGSTLSGTVGGGAGGQPGLAQATIRGDALSGKSLYIYVGNNGNFGAAGKGGNGGAVTAVATEKLSPTPGTLDDILVAAGGGGGGQGFAGANPQCLELPLPPLITDEVFINCAGGDGGIAIAIDEQNRYGVARLGATPPIYTSTGTGSMYVAALGAGEPARFDDGKWVAGAGGTEGSAGSAAFSFAGAPAAGSPATGTWVRETSELTLGTATVLGGNGAGGGGAGGGGVAGGGGSGQGGGAGGASYAVGSNYGLTSGDTFSIPCNPSGFCAQNWLSPADTDQPAVVITFWENLGANPVIPQDKETIDTDQPSLVFEGSGASSGIQYLLENEVNQTVNYGGLINGSATGNVLWTVPSGLLDAGQTYNWFITDQAGNELQAPRSFTVAPGTQASGSTQGWTLYVRSIDGIDTNLPADLKPLSNQPNIPQVATSCQCTCESSDLTATAENPPDLLGSEYPNCGGYVSKDYCDCTWSASGDDPAAPNYWTWATDTGPDCTASSGSCYANVQVHSGSIDLDWASPSNPLNLQVPSRLINITSEPPPAQNGTVVPSLTLPDLTGIEGISGNCGSENLIEVTFTARTNGGIRFKIYANATTGAPANSPVTAIDHWSIASCSWSADTSQPQGGTGGNQVYSTAYMEAQVYDRCQTSIAEQTGETFCLEPNTPYRVEFNGMVPYLPGPMELGFILPGNSSSAPLPANWISTCTLDTTTNNCSSSAADLATVALDFQQADQPRPQETLALNQNANRNTLAASVPLETPSDPSEGTAGAANCSATGTSIQCTWTGNGTWQLPALYTQPGGWVTVQALGGKGGDGGPGAGNSGGTAGRAQAVLPAASLNGQTLYVYVGENGVDAGTNQMDAAGGGAASMVTSAAVPQTFVNNDCSGTASALEAIVIAAGGGGGGWQQNTQAAAAGGAGGVAIGGSGVAQTIGSGSPGGQAGKSLGGQPPAYGNNPFDGTQTVSGGYSADPGDSITFPSGSGAIALGGAGPLVDGDLPFTRTRSWLKNTSFLTLSKPSDASVCGGGETGDLGAGYGGGGHAGGGAGAPEFDFDSGNNSSSKAYAAGGAGGSSWAAGAGAGVTLPSSLSGWQTLANNNPGQVVINVQCPDCDLLTECAMEQTAARPVMRCTFTQSVQSLSLSTLSLVAADLIGQEIGDDVPIYLEAWGGSGGNGGLVQPGFDSGCGSSGAGPGNRGYARSSHSYGALSAAAPTLWLYVGAKGADGATVDGTKTAYGIPGAGGAATLLLKTPLSSELEDALLVAGGGGGGGQGSCTDGVYENFSGPGESAGSAVATTQSATATPFPTDLNDPSGGEGMGGSDRQKTPGNDGIGGLGGGAGQDAKTGWIGIASTWSAGQGAQSRGGSTEGGAGGGGYGGGGAGDIGAGGAFRGGGAGGSYATAATVDDSGAPVLGGGSGANEPNGAMVITFDVCKTYPTLSVCQP